MLMGQSVTFFYITFNKTLRYSEITNKYNTLCAWHSFRFEREIRTLNFDGRKMIRHLKTFTKLSILTLFSGLSFSTFAGFISVDLVARVTSDSPSASAQFGYAVDISDSHVVVGANRENGGAGAVYVFDLLGTQQHKITSSTGVRNGFGNDVAVSGNKIIVGASEDDTLGTNVGAAYLYNADGSGEIRLENPTPLTSDRFGFSVDIDGDTAIVGTPYDDTRTTNAGAAYVYDSNGNLLTSVFAPDVGANDNFGYDVAIDGSNILVGAINNDDGATNSGSAYLFDTSGAAITEYHHPSPASSDNFGLAVALDKNNALIGAPFDNSNVFSNSGMAALFNSATDLPSQSFFESTQGSSNNFGLELAIDGNYALIGSPNNNRGTAYLFDITTGEELFKFSVEDFGHANASSFGFSLAIHDQHLVIGSHLEDQFTTNTGAAYIFKITEETPVLSSPSSISLLLLSVVGLLATRKPRA